MIFICFYWLNGVGVIGHQFLTFEIPGNDNFTKVVRRFPP